VHPVLTRPAQSAAGQPKTSAAQEALAPPRKAASRLVNVVTTKRRPSRVTWCDRTSDETTYVKSLDIGDRSQSPFKARNLEWRRDDESGVDRLNTATEGFADYQPNTVP